MIYAKVDVKLRDHVRAQRAGAAMSTWLWALLYAVEQETDGVVPEVALRLAWAGEKEARRHADLLVAVGLWEAHEDGWHICRFETKNATRAEVAQRRKETRDRVAKFRGNAVGNADCNALHTPLRDVLVTPSTSGDVPGSGSGSGSESESRSDPPDRSGGPPEWFGLALGTVEMQTGETLRPTDSWLRYSGHRAGKGIAPTQQDAVYWLTTVMVPEARRERAEATRQRERDAKFDKARAGPSNDAPPAPYHRPFRPKPEERAPSSEARAALQQITGALFQPPKTGTEDP